MNDEIEKRINKVFESVLGDFSGSHNDTVALIESLAYVELLIAFQDEFKIKFTTQDFFSLRSIKNIRESVELKIDSK